MSMPLGRFERLIVLGATTCSLISLLQTSWLSALGILLAGMLMLIGLRLPFRNGIRPFGIWCASAGIFWMSSVDRYATMQFCQYCPLHFMQRDYRFLGFTMHTQVLDVHNDFVAKIADDIGCPCPHTYTHRGFATRWGLIYYEGRDPGMCCLTYTGKEQREAELNRAIVQAAQADPTLKKKFYYRVIMGGDGEYLWSFIPKRVKCEDLDTDARNEL